MANLHADLSDSAVKMTGKLKMLTGGDLIPAEFKFGTPFTFVNHAKLIFSANKPPEIMEDTSGIWRHVRLIVFPYKFSGQGADKKLFKKLTTPEELSGLLNWALEGLERLRANGWNFSNTRGETEVREEYLRRSSPVQSFLMDCTEAKSDAFESKKELYAAFAEYCRVRNSQSSRTRLSSRSSPATSPSTRFVPQSRAEPDRPDTQACESFRGKCGLLIGQKRLTALTALTEGFLSTLSTLSRDFLLLRACNAKCVVRRVHPRLFEMGGCSGLLHPACEVDWKGKL